MSPRRSRLSGGAAGLAMLLLLGQLGAGQHLAETTHVVCPVDGELMHAESALRTHAKRDAPDTERHGEPHSHDLDHCHLPSLLQPLATVESAAMHIVQAQTTCAKGEQPLIDRQIAISRLHRTAPKTSPPNHRG